MKYKKSLKKTTKLENVWVIFSNEKFKEKHQISTCMSHL